MPQRGCAWKLDRTVMDRGGRPTAAAADVAVVGPRTEDVLVAVPFGRRSEA
jgi:hypothetical protein